MALVGVLLALIIRGYDNNLYTQIGLVLMIALASKNAILIVEFARDLQRRGMSITEAAVEATRRRFRPIVMTSFAFILGVVPLVPPGAPAPPASGPSARWSLGACSPRRFWPSPLCRSFTCSWRSLSERFSKRALRTPPL